MTARNGSRKPKIPVADAPATTNTRAGRKPIAAAFTPSDYEKIRRAAEIDGRPMSQFVVRSAVTAARKILEKFPDSH